MTYNNLFLKQEQEILIVTLNRPDKLNALNIELMKELQDIVATIYDSKNIRSAIITGNGEKSFVAGADISEFLKAKDGKIVAENGQILFSKIEKSPKPIIACVNGFALGGGCELAMSCHFRFASPNAVFGQPEINLGLIPGWGGTQRLTNLIGKARALEFLLTGNNFNAEKALQFGLINYIFPQNELIPKAIEILNIINQKSSICVEETIKAVNNFNDKDTNGMLTELYSFEKCFKSNDAKEGIQAFLDKRKANFKGH